MRKALQRVGLIAGFVVLCGACTAQKLVESDAVDRAVVVPLDALDAESVKCDKAKNNPKCRPTAEPTTAPPVKPTSAPTEPPAPTNTQIPVPTAEPTVMPSATSVPATAAPVATNTMQPTAAPQVTTLVQTDAQRWGIADYPESRPGNATMNRQRGRLLDRALLNQSDAYQRDYLSRVDGNFVGTTEQILEWAARKWFPDQDHDLFKAQAVKESVWDQAAYGDFQNGAYQSFGILQVKMVYWCAISGCDQVKTSTAFSADVAAAAMRAHYDGVIYTGSYEDWNTYPIRQDVPDPTRIRRTLNAWYFGDGATHDYATWEYNGDGQDSEYVAIVLGGKVEEPGAATYGQVLTGELMQRRWKRSDF